MCQLRISNSELQESCNEVTKELLAWREYQQVQQSQEQVLPVPPYVLLCFNVDVCELGVFNMLQLQDLMGPLPFSFRVFALLALSFLGVLMCDVYFVLAYLCVFCMLMYCACVHVMLV